MRFFAPQGRHVAPMGVKFGMEEGIKRAHPQPIFGPCLLWPNGWMYEDLGPGHIVLDGVPAPNQRKGHSSPLFSAHVYYGHGRPSQLLLSSSLRFYSACNARIASAVSATAIPSICLSVCPSHAGIVSKRRHVARCSLHRWIAKCV